MTAPVITERSVIGRFAERLNQDTGQGWINAICAEFDSDQDSEKYPWLGQVPQLSVKKGQKKFTQLRTTEWEVANVEYQGGIQIPKKHILYDKTSQVMMRVDEAAERANAHWISLVAPLIVAGESTACYDDQFFFDTDHSEGSSGSQSNDISADISTYPVATHGTTTEPAVGEMVHAIMDGINQLISLKDDQGEYCNENMTEFLVVCGPSLSKTAMAAVGSELVDNGASNLLVDQNTFKIRVVVSPRFSSWTTKFAIFGLNGTQKPIIKQQRIPNNAGGGYDVNGMLLQSLWLDSEHCKLKDECLVSIETERAAAYGDWKKACLVTLI